MTKIPSKKELKKYLKYLDKEAKKFKLTGDDLSNLYDLFYMVDVPKKIILDLRSTLKMNKMDNWFDDFHNRVEKIVIPEFRENNDELSELIKNKVNHDKKQKKKEVANGS